MGKLHRLSLTLFFILLFLCNVCTLHAFIEVIRFPFAPNQINLNDVWNFSLINSSGENKSIIIQVDIKSGRKGLYGELFTQAIILTPGYHKFNGYNIGKVHFGYLHPEFAKALKYTSNFPEDFYDIVIKILDSETKVVIEPESYMSNEVRTVLPPHLITPQDGGEVSDEFIIWSWMIQPTSGISKYVLYDLEVAELLEGQSSEEALESNPLIILKKDLNSNIWQTDFAARSFLYGHKYAWRVTAKIEGNVTIESEIRSFTYKKGNPIFAQDEKNNGRDELREPRGSLSEYLSNANNHGSLKLFKNSNCGRNSYNNMFLSDLNQNGAEAIIEKEEMLLKDSSSQKPAIEFSGKSRLTLENSNRSGILSSMPASYARLEFQPSLNIYGVPFSLNILLSTEKNATSSSLERGSFGVTNTDNSIYNSVKKEISEKINYLKNFNDSNRANLSDFSNLLQDSTSRDSAITTLQNLANSDLSENLSILKRYGLISSEQEILAQIPTFGFGVVLPQFSELFMNNISINGGLIEYNPGNFYSAAAFGKVQKEVYLSNLPFQPLNSDSTLMNPAFHKNVYTGRVGYGRKNKNNVIFSALYSKDDASTVALQKLLDSTSNYLGNEENIVLGLSGNVAFDSLGLKFEGELNTSLFSKNASGYDIENSLTPKIYKTIYGDKLKNGSQADFSASGRIIYKLPFENGRIQGGLRYIGPGYKTTGSLGLINDYFRYDMSYNQIFFDRQFMVSVLFSKEETGKSIIPSNSSINQYLNANLEIKLKTLPVFNIIYTHTRQELIRSIDSIANDNNLSSLFFSGSYVYNISGTVFFTNCTYSYRSCTSPYDILRFSSNSFILSQKISLNKVLSFGAEISYYNTSIINDSLSKPIFSLNISMDYIPNSWFYLTLGYDTNNSQYADMNNFFVCIRSVITENMDVEMRYDSRKFKNSNLPIGNFKEDMFKLVTYYRI